MTSRVPISILDLAAVNSRGGVRAALDGCVSVAQQAETSGYRRVWYAEHHNMSAIASSAPAVLIAHVAAHTRSIRLGSGGVMLPNHSPLVIAEQFGTLAELHPGRIDLGLGRAPGTDQLTLQSLRRTPMAAESFPSDVIELGRLLGEDLPRTAVNAYPGRGTQVPRYILGSSLFGAELAGRLGLPFAFASHFAPDALLDALARYRSLFTPSAELERPHAIVAVNVVTAPTAERASDLLAVVRRERVRRFLSIGRPVELSAEEAEQLIDHPAGQHVLAMMRVTAAGTPDETAAQLDALVTQTGANELITAHPQPDLHDRLESVRLTAEAWGIAQRGGESSSGPGR